MSVREKLIDVIQNSVGGCARHWAEVIADGLIAHGVTIKDVPDIYVGEWISVKDRLPEETQAFLVVLNNEDIDIRVFNSKNEPFQSYSSMLDKFLFLDDKGEWHTTDRVTHWMPLPQPPKGE